MLHVIPTAISRGAQREARALVDLLDRPGVRRHRLMSLFSGPAQVVVDLHLSVAPRHGQVRGFHPLVVPTLRRALRRAQPAAVVAHGSDPMKYLVPAMTGLPAALVYYVIGTYDGPPGRRAQRELWHHLMLRADLLAACGDDTAAECIGAFRVPASRVEVVYNGRDADQFRPPGARRDAVDDPLVVFAGALTPGKRPDVFVEVVDGLRRRGLSLRAWLVGDGPMRESLSAPAAAAGVELLGQRSDVAALLAQADLLVFPSRPAGEGMPGVLIEAGLCGLPVVATDVPGVRSIVVDQRSGIVVGRDDTPALVAGAAHLLGDPILRRAMGEAARAHCVEHFSLPAVAGRWEALVDRAVDGGL